MNFQETHRKAVQGDAHEQFALGAMYRLGICVPEDCNEALKWYLKAAEQGHAYAQCDIGLMYATGEGVPKDYEEALKWYLKAAERGHASAQLTLGVMYYNGQGVPKDDAEAVKWFQKAYDQGMFLARGYLKGEQTEMERDKCERYVWRLPSLEELGRIQRAAEQGDAEAQFTLGRLYETGEGVPRDDAEAVKWFQQAAEQGHTDAQDSLGRMYRFGLGVAKDDVEAEKWFSKAAGNGRAAQEELGRNEATEDEEIQGYRTKL